MRAIDYKNITDADIWAEIKIGNKKAFDYIYSTYASVLLDYGRHFSHDVDLLEDVLQETYLEIWFKKEKLSLHSSIKFYLFTSFRRKLFKKISTDKKTITLDIDEQFSFYGFSDSVESKYIETELLKQKKQLIETALQKLAPRQKESVYLKYYQNLSFQEVAQVMSITTKSAYKIIAKSLEKLEKILSDTDYFNLYSISIIFFNFFFEK
ncbi:MAG: hypothetical protein CMO01_16760 [Thalassobius sp.]|nr:hypothetical protein [Thalassovita sp.]